MKINLSPHFYNTKVNFSSRRDTKVKTERFADEFISALNSGNISLNKAETIAQKYVPDIKIRELKNDTDIYNNVGGSYGSHFVYLENPNRVETVNRRLKIRLDGYSKKNIRDKVVTIVHEMMHAIQSSDKDIGDDVIISRLLKKYPLEDWPEQVLATGEVFSRLEKEILEPMIFAHMDICSANDGIDPFVVRMNSKIMRKLVKNKLDEAKMEKPKIDMDFLKKMVYLQAMDEYDAYKTEEKIKRKLNLGESCEKDGYIAYLYHCLAKSLGVGDGFNL